MSLRGRVGAGDVAIAAGFVAAVEFEIWNEGLEPRWLASIAFAVMGAALVLRRAAPHAALVIGFTSQLVAALGGVSLQTAVTPLIFFVLVLYAVGVREERRRAIAGLVAALALMAVTLAVAHGNGEFEATDIPFVILVMCMPWFVARRTAARGQRRARVRAAAAPRGA